MIRKLILGAAAAAAIGFGTQTASAAPPTVVEPSTANAFHRHRVDIDYIVMVERHGCWERYGRYDTFEGARRAEWRLQHDGFRVRIDEVRDRR
jgi:hypothetical protein